MNDDNIAKSSYIRIDELNICSLLIILTKHREI
jgi:hypothetical protein